MASSLGGIGDAFADRNFRRYSAGAIVSWLSFFVQSVAVSWTAWDLTHSARWLAIVAVLDAAPNIVLMPLGGVLADRYDRFRILLTAYAVATLQAALLAGLAFSGALTIGWLAALASLHGAAHAFSIPAQYGMLPRFVDRTRMASAISVSAAYTQLGLFAGPALAGWVIVHYGTAVAFAANVAGYACYFACVATLRTPPGYSQPAASGKALVADLLDGLRAIAGHRGIVALLALMLCGDALAATVRQMAPALSATVLGAGVAGVSTLLSCGGIGATLSALWLAHGGAKRVASSIILRAFLGVLAGFAALPLSPSLPVAGAAMVVLGCSFEICRTGAVALLQTSVPDAVRGRVMSTQFLLLRLAGAVGVSGIGAAAGTWGLRVPMLAAAGGALLVWCFTIRARARIAADFAPPVA